MDTTCILKAELNAEIKWWAVPARAFEQTYMDQKFKIESLLNLFAERAVLSMVLETSLLEWQSMGQLLACCITAGEKTGNKAEQS